MYIKITLRLKIKLDNVNKELINSKNTLDNGKIELERKEEMKKRGLTSPDRRRCVSSFFI